MGLLTGKYSPSTGISVDDVRGQKSPAWMKYFKDGRPSAEYIQKVNSVREILTAGGRTVSQGALGWLWACSPKTVPSRVSAPSSRCRKTPERWISGR